MCLDLQSISDNGASVNPMTGAGQGQQLGNQWMKKICIINTGGTIGMSAGPDGLRPEPGFIAEQLALMPELNNPSMPQITVQEYEPVIDSSNIQVADWRQLAGDIAGQYEQFDGFVVLHGTDTMAYTASALPFMLRGLGKPVILTGSQLPLADVRNDARENLKTALLLAAGYTIPEVCIYFGELLLRGCRATKHSAASFNAFSSPNYPPLGSAGTELEVFQDRVLPVPPLEQGLSVESLQPQEIATFRLFPGVSVEVLQNVLQRPLKALILESFGDGNGPSRHQGFVECIRDACQAGIVILNLSQCGHGSIRQTAYETGAALEKAGVVSGCDMTIEAALAKLTYLFSRDLSVEQVKTELQRDLVGELTGTVA
ncbi:MAG: asparaginase [Mariniblastus sp.]|nr:asparaginase [Mariniblastus sp.]